MNKHTEEEWLEEFDQLFGPNRDKMVGSSKARTFIRKTIAKERQKAMEEVLELIADGEGWEESREHYRKIIKAKYTK